MAAYPYLESQCRVHGSQASSSQESGVEPTSGPVGQLGFLDVGRQTGVVAEPSAGDALAVSLLEDEHRVVYLDFAPAVRAIGHEFT